MKIRHHIYVAAVAAMLTTGAYAADIKFGVLGPYTGGSSPMGVSNRGGIRMAVNEINAAGGINGNKIVLVERDDEAKNERGVQISQEFVNNEKVAAVLGFVNTGVVLASSRFYQDAKIPVITMASGSIVTKQFPNAPENYIFRISAADNIQAPLIAKEAVEKRGFKKVARQSSRKAFAASSTSSASARRRRTARCCAGPVEGVARTPGTARQACRG